MKVNSIDYKITLNFKASIVVIIMIALLTLSSFILIFFQYKSHKKILFPIINLNKDLEYLIDKHWNQYNFVKINSDSLILKKNTLLNIESKIDSLFYNFYDLFFNDHSIFLSRLNFSTLINQLIEIDMNFREYSFIVNKHINTITLESSNFSEENKIKLQVLQIQINDDIELLTKEIELFINKQHRLFKFFIISLTILLAIISVFFVGFYIILWRKTKDAMSTSFKHALVYLKKSLEKKSIDDIKLDSVESEIRQFIHILKKSIIQLHASENHIKQINEKLGVVRQEERKQIAQHLHDNLGQNISALQLENKVLTSQLKNVDLPSQNTLNRVDNILNDSNKLLKQITNNLRIPDLKKYGLLTLVKKLIKDRNDLGLTKFELKTLNIEKLNYDDKTLVIYQCIQEGVNNILKHAKATYAQISIVVKDYFIEIQIKDDGIGITKKSFDTMGIDGMQQAVEDIAGVFKISSLENNGTTLNIEIPI